MHTSFSAVDKVDLVFHDPREDEYVVIIIHSGDWDGSTDEEESLKQKLNAYAQFLLGRQFERLYPEAKAKKVRIQIYGPAIPPECVRGIINQADTQLLAHSIRVDFALV
jgi:hypothetical protein